MNTDYQKLFAEFPPITTGEWEALIMKDLKGADYQKKLVWKTMEGFDVKPYYRKEDLENIRYLNEFPGDFPFVRSGRKNGNDWLIREDLLALDISEANKKALDILMKGVDSLGFVIDPTKKTDLNEIEKLMENIYAQSIEVNFVCGRQAPEVLDIYIKLVQKYNRDFQKIRGSVNYDPIGFLIRSGNFYKSEKADFDVCKNLVESSRNLPLFRTLAVNAAVFRNSGSSIVEELAFAMAYANEYLTRLTDKGIPVDNISPKIKFQFGVGSNYFMEIAKIRAARFLWAKIVNVYSPKDQEFTRAYIHSVTTDWNKTIYDAYANMLRTTTEAMSAIIGGTNSLTIRPFNAHFEETTAFSERIARNQQLLLKEESYFDKVVDPAAGSWYIENLTDSLIGEAWKLFIEIDEMGGFVDAFKKGFIQQRISETAKKRDNAIATRREILLGTNQYPNFTENIASELDEVVFQPADFTMAKAIAETLKPYRGAQSFENLRYKTDIFSLESKRPAAFMLTYGNLAMRRARSQFSGNFFACAGFEIIDNNGFKTVDEGVEAALASKAEFVVVCGADDDYPVIGPEIFAKTKGKAHVVIAGYPKDSIDALKAAGIRHFIHIKSNVLETLQEFQKMIGIE